VSAERRRLIPLSHDIFDGLITYPGLPGPEVTDHMSREDSRSRYAPGTEFQIGRISLVANTGTYLDTPFHRFEGGTDLATMPLEAMADLPGLVIATSGRAIDRDLLEGHDVRGRAILFHTGWDRHFATEQYGVAAPFLTAAAATWLVDHGASLAGIDSINIDDMADPARPAHTALLAASIPIVEHMRGLGAVPREGFRFHAVPPPIRGMGSFPVRAYAVIDD
jgi:arylformamidase